MFCADHPVSFQPCVSTFTPLETEMASDGSSPVRRKERISSRPPSGALLSPRSWHGIPKMSSGTLSTRTRWA
ncbi:hypothetical protein GDO78_018176, partial [Eleutherodactylus coqui]